MPNGPHPPALNQAIQVWNLLGGAVDYGDGLATLAEMIGFEDIEMLIHHLVLIRDFQHG